MRVVGCKRPLVESAREGSVETGIQFNYLSFIRDRGMGTGIVQLEEYSIEPTLMGSKK